MTALGSFIGQKDREQTVWTPEFILDRVDCVFPEGWFDAFPSPGSPSTARGCNEGVPFNAWLDPWWWFNYANPPFQHPDLQLALTTAREQFAKYERETLMLAPARTRRDWWCAAVAGFPVTYLKSFPFLDSRTGQPYRSGKANQITHFPENLVIVYFGRGRVADFRDAFADVSAHFQRAF